MPRSGTPPEPGGLHHTDAAGTQMPRSVRSSRALAQGRRFAAGQSASGRRRALAGRVPGPQASAEVGGSNHATSCGTRSLAQSSAASIAALQSACSSVSPFPLLTWRM